MRKIGWMAVFALVAGLTACGDDDSESDTGTPDDAGDVRDEGGSETAADADADADADLDTPEAVEDVPADEGGGGGDSLTFIVVDQDEDPLLDVQVLVQTAATPETWLVTNGDGEVTIDGLDLAADPPTVSFFAAGYTYVTYVAVDRQLTDNTIVMSEIAATESQTVSGTVNGVGADQGALVTIWSSVYGFVGSLVNDANTYSRSMPLDQTATELTGQALAFDDATGLFENFVHATTPYSGGNATFDFTLPATAPGITHVTVNLAWPTGFSGFPSPAYVPDLPYDIFEVIGANDTDGASFGLSESVAASSSPVGLELGLGWVTDRAGFTVDEIGGTYTVAGSADFEVVAQIYFDTLPADGATIDVLDPPEFTTPALGSSLRVSSQTAEWTVPDWSSYTNLFLVSLSRDTEYWTVVLPKGVTTFQFPPIPPSFSALPFPMLAGIYVRGWEGSPASVWELFDAGEEFTATHTYYGSVYDVRTRAIR